MRIVNRVWGEIYEGTDEVLEEKLNELLNDIKNSYVEIEDGDYVVRRRQYDELEDVGYWEF